MSVYINFNCKDLTDGRTIEFNKHKWYCEKRESYFDDVDKHCRDCERYEEMYQQLKAFLEGDCDE